MPTDTLAREMIVEAPVQMLESDGVIETKPAPAFERLHALVRKGYVANIGAGAASDSVELRHLGKAPDLVLHGDGMIEGLDGHRPWHKRSIEPPAPIPAETDGDHLRFMKFLDTVPPTTLRDRTRPWRRRYIYIPAGLLVFWGLCLAFTVMLLEGA